MSEQLSEKGKDLVKYMPQAVNALADRLIEKLEERILYGEKPKTNYDLLISKAPEELADSFASRCCPVKDEFYNCGEINKKEFSWEDCKSCWLDWLKAPVEEVDNEPDS